MSVLAVIGKILLILLKILGWTLLGVLGLVLLILLLVLFLPIGYEAKASAVDKDYKAEAKVHLLLKAVSARVAFVDKQLTGDLRIFWIKKQLFGKKEEPPAEESSTAEAKPETEDALDLSDPGVEDESPAEESSGPAEEKPKPEAVKPESAKPEPAKPEPAKPEEPPEGAEPEVPKEKPEPEPDVYTFLIGPGGKEVRWEGRLPFSDKIENTVQTIYGKYNGISGKVKSIIAKIQKTVYKVESLLAAVRDYPDRPYLTALLIRILKKLGRRLRPRRFEVNVRYGMDSPVTTGRIAAWYGILSVLLGDIKHYQIRTTPDFEKKILNGDLYLKGRVQGYMFVFPVLRLAVDRKIWRLIKVLRKKKAAPAKNAE